MSAYFDLHCDTLMHCTEGKNLIENDLAISIKRGLVNAPWAQAFAAFIHDDYTKDDEGYKLFLKMAEIFRQTLAQNPDLVKEYDPRDIDPARCNAMFTVEGGAAINGKPERLQELKDLGVRIFSLVWSKENELAGGVDTDIGLKPAGVETVKELERLGIILDVSHLNTKGFWEMCKIARKPFIATHSNAISVGSHRRNLSDEQIKELLSRGGIIGLTYCMPFIHNRDEDDASYDDMARQIEHMLSLGAENQLALGSDFDGAHVPSAMNGIQTMPAFVDFIERKFGAELARKISFDNANEFFKKNWPLNDMRAF